MIRKRRILVRGVSLCAAAAIALPAGGAAANVPAGFDLFETDPQATQFQFQGGTAIPAGFFSPGSDPFTGVVKFGGVPLETFNGQGTGDADTIVARRATAIVPPMATIPIEIVALNLVSVEPITVTHGGGQPELWDVTTSIAQTQPQGNMTIRQDSAAGGTFDSQLPVQPRLTFTRLSDGQQRALDLPPIPFQAQNVPWRAGCILPALAVPGLNDAFCPGLTTLGQKRLTIEQALFANHGVYPVQPHLEHFKCYKLRKQGFKPRTVTLADQFGQRVTKVRRRAELCIPVRKNDERLLNAPAHLQCYGLSGPSLNVAVAVRNQFGSQRLLVRSPKRLCLPTTKTAQPAKGQTKRNARQAKRKPKPKKIEVPIDHFQCYGVSSQTELRARQQPGRVKLVDQFHRERRVKLGKPIRLCAPVAKNNQPIQHPVRHLVCYQIRGTLERQVSIRNQFGSAQVTTVGARALCVPSLKTRA